MPEHLTAKVEEKRPEAPAATHTDPMPAAPHVPGSGASPRSAPRPLGNVPATEDVPQGYGISCLVLLVRDPSWIHSYWEITTGKYEEALASLKLQPGETASRVLRVYDVAGAEFNGYNAQLFFDIRVDDFACNWYFRVDPNRTYCAELGLLSSSGQFAVMARSNTVTTPRAGMSEVIDDKWGTVAEGYYENMYALSGGFEVGKSSLELRHMLEERLRSELSSGAVSSFGASPVRKGAGAKGRGFWFVLDAELIVYGATAPDATVTVQGRQVRLRPDGSFTLRFALPDGVQHIDAVARAADGLEERSIIPTVSRTTEVPEPVLHTEEQ
ncbi:MAG TPA: DUF4912 domain-containing protein [Planctomycetes bacterium]|nr:DUF4912 domain-containing protein [Planctomycetota bacterium]